MGARLCGCKWVVKGSCKLCYRSNSHQILHMLTRNDWDTLYSTSVVTRSQLLLTSWWELKLCKILSCGNSEMVNEADISLVWCLV